MYVKARMISQRKKLDAIADVYVGGPHGDGYDGSERYYVVEVGDVNSLFSQVRLSKSELREVHEMIGNVLNIEQQTVAVQVSIPSIVDLTVERT